MSSLNTLEEFITAGIFYPALTINQLTEALLTLQNCDHLHYTQKEEEKRLLHTQLSLSRVVETFFPPFKMRLRLIWTVSDRRLLSCYPVGEISKAVGERKSEKALITAFPRARLVPLALLCRDHSLSICSSA